MRAGAAAMAVVAGLAVTPFAVSAQSFSDTTGLVLEGFTLIGLARSGSFTVPQEAGFSVMVCNLSDPEDYLSIRRGPGTEYPVERSLNRFSFVAVDPNQRDGNWVRVLGAGRDTDVFGRQVPYVDLPVTGWAHDGYLCDYL